MNVKELVKRMFSEDPNPMRMSVDAPKVDVLSAEQIYEKLAALPTGLWDRYAFRREPLRDRFPMDQQKEMAAAARSSAVACAKDLQKRYPGLSVPELAKKLNVQVERVPVPKHGGQVLFAQFQEPGTVTLFTDCLGKLAVTLESFSTPPVTAEEIETLLLAHELYHYMETQDTTLYSEAYRIQLWKLGPFSNCSRVFCLGEIAAMAFAKMLTGASFEPYLLDVLLVYGYSPDAATNLCNQIVEMAQREGFLEE